MDALRKALVAFLGLTFFSIFLTCGRKYLLGQVRTSWNEKEQQPDALQTTLGYYVDSDLSSPFPEVDVCLRVDDPAAARRQDTVLWATYLEGDVDQVNLTEDMWTERLLPGQDVEGTIVLKCYGAAPPVSYPLKGTLTQAVRLRQCLLRVLMAINDDESEFQ